MNARAFIHDLIAAVRAALREARREFRHLRQLRRERDERIARDPIPF